VVVKVERNAPAARGGLIPGDLILALNDKPIKTSEDFAKVVQMFKPGETVKVDLLRDGQKGETEITVENMPARR
jgi:serine protease Do